MTSSSPRLAAADMLLLREVFAWARANGWRRDHDTWPDSSDWHWYQHEKQGRISLELSLFDSIVFSSHWRLVGSESLDAAGFGFEFARDESLSLVQVVDILCAVGILPARFSSAFAAGRESAWTQAETEWSARMKDGRPAFACTFTEGGARRYADEQPDRLAVFTRRVGPWKRVD